MNPLLQEFLVASLRHLLTVFGVWLLTKGWVPFDRADIEKYAFGFAVLFVAWLWSMWNKYKSRIKFLTAMESPAGTPEADIDYKVKTFPPKLMVFVLLATLPFTQACAMRQVPVVVAQTSLGLAQSVGQLQIATEQLQRGGVITVQQAITMQEKLLAINTKIGRIVPVLKAFDRLTASGVKPTIGELDVAISDILSVSGDLSVVVAGVPVGDATRALMDLVRVSQTTVATTLVEVARLRVALEK